MPMNAVYRNPGDLAAVIPVFPLPGALLLPRGQMPLNIFEPRYVAMIDDSLRGHRLIGMIQPDDAHPGPESKPNLYKIGCVGRITQIAETGDGRYLLQLTGVARFRVEEELSVSTPYRQCRVSYAPFIDDFTARKGEDIGRRNAPAIKALMSRTRGRNAAPPLARAGEDRATSPTRPMRRDRGIGTFTYRRRRRQWRRKSCSNSTAR